MSKRESIARYNLIIKRLKRNPASFAEILDSLKEAPQLQDYKNEISKRTFTRDIKDIYSLYGIDIQYDFSGRVYKIITDEQPEMSERILEAFDTFNALNISNQVSGFVCFEKRNPQGTEHFYGLLHAIKNRFQIQITYQAFWENAPNFRMLEPYALKEYRNRWYVLAKDRKDNKIKTFALDRITALNILNIHYQYPKNFSVDEYFRYCYGVITQRDEEPQEVILSLTPFQGKYIKSLPLHKSQEILKDDAQELVVRLNLFITHDFFMEILSLGAEVKVLQPESLRQKIQEEIKRMQEIYSGDAISKMPG